MKHSTSYNSPGSLSSPVVIAAAFPSAAGASCSSSHSLRPQRWSRSHRTTPHQPQRPPNVTSNTTSNVLRANRTSARSLRGTQDKTIQREFSSNLQGSSKVVQPSHVQRRHKQQRQQPNNITSVASETNVEAKAEDVTHDSVGVKATRKAKRRQTRRRRHTSPLQEKQQEEEEERGQLSVTQSDNVLGGDVKTSVTTPAAQNESQPTLVSSTTQATKEAHEQEEEETPPKRRQRRPRRRAQQRQTRRQQSAKVSTTVTATTPIVPEGSQGNVEKQVKDNGSNTTPTNTATTTASSVASSGPHDQHKAQSSRCNGEANALTATTTEKPKRVRHRRQRRQKPRREAVSSTQQLTQHPLPVAHQTMEDNVASTPMHAEKDATVPSRAQTQEVLHNPPSALPTHSPVAALFSVPPAALRHSAPTATTTTSAANNVSRLTSAANEEERQDTTTRRVGALPVFPSRPDLTQLTYNELSLFDSTTAAAFSLSSGTGGVMRGDEDGESTSPMTLATSCSPTSIHAPTSNGLHIPSVNMQKNDTTTQEVMEDEVGLRRRGLRVRAVAFQPRNSSGDEKDNNHNNSTAGESTGASFGVRRRRGRRAVRPGAVLTRHNYSVSDVDNVQHSCVAMSDVVAKDETLMFNMLVGNAEGDVDLVAGGDAAHMNDEAAAGNELNDEDEEDDDEEEEEVLMDLCGLRGAVPRTAPMPRHIAPGGGYWSEDNNTNSSSAVGGRSSYERSAYYYSMSYARAASRNSLTTSQSQVQPPHLHRQRSQPSLSYYETLTPQIAALLLPPAPNSASRDPSPTRTFRGTMSVMSTNEAMTDVDQWEMNSSVYEESLDEAQVQWIEEQLRASENPEGFFG